MYPFPNPSLISFTVSSTFSRIVPLEDYYTFSGVSRVISKKDFEWAKLAVKNLAFSRTSKEEKGGRVKKSARNGINK
jgi:hypothetical protein